MAAETLWMRGYKWAHRRMSGRRVLDPNHELWSDSERAPRHAAMVARDAWVAGYKTALKDGASPETATEGANG